MKASRIVAQIGLGAAVAVLAALGPSTAAEKTVAKLGEPVADFTLVDAGDFTTPGAIAGWIQIEVEDTRAAGITDGDFYIPIYAVPTA